MLNVQDRLRPNEEHVAAKVMDGEAVLINLANGFYYSMGGAGGFMWSLITQRHAVGDIARFVCDRFSVSNEQALADVQTLASRLLEEELAILCDVDTQPVEGVELEKGPKLPYQPPELTRYEDMADMFALDPPLPGLADVSADKLPERSKD